MSDLYGINNDSLVEIKKIIEKTLNIEFEDRYSDYLGGDYCLAEINNPQPSKIKIIKNLSESPVNEGWYEDEYQDYDFIIEIESDLISLKDEILNKILSNLNNVIPLRRLEFNESGYINKRYIFVNNEFICV
jgi:hypothetical protein